MTNLAWETSLDLAADQPPSNAKCKANDNCDFDLTGEEWEEETANNEREEIGGRVRQHRRRERQSTKPVPTEGRKLHRNRTHDGTTEPLKRRATNNAATRGGPSLQRSKSLQGPSEPTVRPLRRHRRREVSPEETNYREDDDINGEGDREEMSRSTGRRDQDRSSRQREGVRRTSSNPDAPAARRRVSHGENKRPGRRTPARSKSEELAGGSEGGDRMRYYRDRASHHPHREGARHSGRRDRVADAEGAHAPGRRERPLLDGSHNRRPAPRRAKSYIDRPGPPGRNSPPQDPRVTVPLPRQGRSSAKESDDALFDSKLVGLLAHEALPQDGPEILLDHEDDSGSVSDYGEDEDDDLAFKMDFGYGDRATDHKPVPLGPARDAEPRLSLFAALSKTEPLKKDRVKQSDDDSVGSEGTAATTSSTLSLAKEKLSNAKKKVAGSLLKLVSGPNNSSKVERVCSSNQAVRGTTIMGPMLKLGCDDDNDDDDDDEDFY